jgi:phosphoribosylanthranilate isomerase
MFRIKICGITNLEDALSAADAGADTIGLNFYSKSPRFIDASTASTILQVSPPQLTRVGVCVNEEINKLNLLISKLGKASPVGLHAIQLHGDEPPSYCAQVRSKYLIRARKLTEKGVSDIAADLEACDRLRRLPDAILIDSAVSGQYGGTGIKVSWTGLADYRRWLHNVPLILAGGLTPQNVADAIRIVRPHGVDVASGVESSPGKKDAKMVRDFVQASREAFVATDAVKGG